MGGMSIGPIAARPAVRTGIEPRETGPQRGHTGAGHERRVGEALWSDRLLAGQAVEGRLNHCPWLVAADGHIQAVARDGKRCAADERANLAVGQGTGLVVARGGQPPAGDFGRIRLNAATSSQFCAPLLRPCRCPVRWPEAVLEPVAVVVDRDDLAVVQKAVEDCGGQNLLAEGLAPLTPGCCEVALVEGPSRLEDEMRGRRYATGVARRP